MGLLRGLRNHGHTADLAAFHQGALGPGVPSLSSLCRKARWVRVTRGSLRFRAFLSLFGSVPANVAAYRSGAMRALVSEMLGAESYDLILAYRLRMAPYALAFSGPRLLDLTDCLTLFSGRSVRGAASFWSRLYHRWEHTRLKSYEPKVCGDFSKVLITSPVDRDALGLAGNHCEVVGNGVSLEERPFRPLAGRSGILFLGNMGYAPNREAADWLVEEIVPKLPRTESARVCLMGSHPPGKVPKGDPWDGHDSGPLCATGFRKDIGPPLLRSRVMVVPLRRGAGVQNKVLDAMAAGLPVVATPLAGEGLGLRDGAEYLKAGTTEEFVGALRRVLEDEALAGRLAAAGRSKVESEFTWEKQWAKLERVVQECVRGV